MTSPEPSADLIAAAKREGSVNFTASLSQPEFTALANAFKAKYDITVTPTAAAGAEILTRFDAEVKTGNVQADVFQFSDLTALKNFADQGAFIRLTPAEVPALALYDAAYITDYWVLFGNQPFPIAVNTRLVDPPIKDWPDVLAPRFADRKLGYIRPSTSLAYVSAWVNLEQKFGQKYVTDFLAQKPVLYPDSSQAAAALAAGEVQALVVAVPSRITALKANGAPLDMINVSTVTGDPRPLSVTAKGPHPNAARLFASWFLSAEAQQILWGTGNGIAFIRGGVPGQMPVPGNLVVLDQATQVAPQRARLTALLEGQ